MKKPYAQSTLKRKYRETGIPKSVLEKLNLYFIACSCFYKAINIDEVWEVILKTEERMSRMDVEDYINADMVECIRFLIVEEFHNQLNDELMERSGTDEPIDYDGVLDELEKREAEYEKKEEKRALEIAMALSCHLKFSGHSFNEDSYELRREDFDAVVKIKERDAGRYLVLQENELYEDGNPSTRYLVDIHTIMAFENGEPVGIDFDGVYSVLDESYYKPLYIPQDILNYINSSYYESTPQTKAMEVYLRKLILSHEEMGEDELEITQRVLMSGMHRVIIDEKARPTETIQNAINMIEDKGYLFRGEQDMEKFLKLFMELLNHTRLPKNKGHSPLELLPAEGAGLPANISFGPNVRELLRSGEWDARELKRDIMTQDSWPMELRGNMIREINSVLEPGEERIINSSGTVVKGRKIKPNEPCPCGSGRKYKHCCGRHS